MSCEIRVERGKAPSWRGKLTYKGNIHLSVDCYWEAIFLPSVPGFRGIFIHYGKNLHKVDHVCIWSDGCIVLDEAHVLAIWNDITPLNGHNVRVTVVDK